MTKEVHLKIDRVRAFWTPRRDGVEKAVIARLFGYVKALFILAFAVALPQIPSVRQAPAYLSSLQASPSCFARGLAGSDQGFSQRS